MMKKMLMLATCAVVIGCFHDGKMATIHYDGKPIATTQCNGRVLVNLNPDTVQVQSQYYAPGSWTTIERYIYRNDGKFSVAVQNCTYKD